MNKKHMRVEGIILSLLIIISGITTTNAHQISAESLKRTEPPTDNSLSTNGTILYVGGSGPGNYSAIQNAIDNTSNGDIVFVYDESSPYYENIYINNSIDLIGENRETTVIDGNRSGNIITILADHVEITGFTVTYSGWDYFERNAGIKIFSSNNTISEMNITVNLNGIYISSAHRNIISDSSFKYNRDGIRIVDGSTDNIVEENIFTSSSRYTSMFIWNMSDHNIVQNNTFINYDGKGLCIQDSQETIVKGNMMKSCESGILLYHSNYTYISDNIFQWNEDGLVVDKSWFNTISYNTFEGDGIYVYNSFQNIVSDNNVNDKPLIYLEGESQYIIPNDAGQIVLIDCDNIKIEEQHINDTNIGIELWGCENCDIKDNDLIHNRRNIYLRDSNFTTIKDNTLKSNESYIFKQTLDVRNCRDTNITDNTIITTDDYTYAFIEDSHETTVAHNIFSGPSMVLILKRSDECDIIDNTFSPSWGIRLTSCSKNDVLRNEISGGNIILQGSQQNIISRNTLSNEKEACGITMEDSDHNIITRNTIDQCDGGFSLVDSKSNIIVRNNIIDCGVLPAWFSNSLTTLWFRNYWGRMMLKPKLILGEIRIIREWPQPPLILPVLAVDLFPKALPFRSVINS